MKLLYRGMGLLEADPDHPASEKPLVGDPGAAKNDNLLGEKGGRKRQKKGGMNGTLFMPGGQ
ncbi:MAG TPA: hypothetical protein VGU67_02550 [Edaphobacter sp.]|nr:hypothetical protein [Edaphobacter sp.]